jgi:hypothetical protein
MHLILKFYKLMHPILCSQLYTSLYMHSLMFWPFKLLLKLVAHQLTDGPMDQPTDQPTDIVMQKAATYCSQIKHSKV